MISPLLAGSLIGAAGSTISGIGQIIPSKMERENKAKLEELKRKQEMGALGLTPQEMQAMDTALSGRAAQAAAQAKQERDRLLASSGTALGGQQMALAVAADEARMKEEQAVADRILQEDIKRKQEQEAQIANLESGLSDQRALRIKAIAGGVLGGLDAFTYGKAVSKAKSGALDITPEMTSAISKKLNISEEAARGIADQMKRSPDAAAFIDMILAEKR